MAGTALPVLVDIEPSMKFDFGECPVGEHADVLCTIHNNSDELPAIYQFRKIAHFTTHPGSGKIEPGKSQDIIFSFTPRQIGKFKKHIALVFIVFMSMFSYIQNGMTDWIDKG